MYGERSFVCVCEVVECKFLVAVYVFLVVWFVGVVLVVFSYALSQLFRFRINTLYCYPE